MRSGSTFGPPSAAATRLCDGVLDFLVLALAAWTAVYHVCLVLRVSVLWATVAAGAALVACARLALAGDARRAGSSAAPGRAGAPAALAAAAVLTGVAAAGLFAFTDVRWRVIWAFWALAATAAVVVASRRPDGSLEGEGRPSGPGALVALLWALGVGLHSLFVVTSASDDTYYVHLSAWIAGHGVFPLRDTLFSDEVLPALFYPPVSSFEALVGAAGHVTGLTAADLTYLVVAPLAGALSVLALWRLLRSWRAEPVGLALSVAMVFLFLDAASHRAVGLTALTRSWHGKTILLAVLVPLLFALFDEYVERPTRRRLALLAGAGAAGVGLSSSGVFLVPVVAAGCAAGAALRSPRRAAAGLLAAAAYPVGAGVAVLAVGGRTPLTGRYVAPGRLVDDVLTTGVPAFVAITAVLVAPVLLRRARAARMAAATVLLVGLLFTPPALLALFHVVGQGQTMWRLSWALPIAALVGVLAVGPTASIRAPGRRVVPAALLCAALVAWGTPIWSARGVSLAAEPSWKRHPKTVETARWILAAARPGDTVLAPKAVSQTIAVMSGTVTSVAPRGFYARALRDVPGGLGWERVLLQRFASTGLGGGKRGGALEAGEVVRALGHVGVELACIRRDEGARRLLAGAGFRQVGVDAALVCLRASPRPGLGSAAYFARSESRVSAARSPAGSTSGRSAA